MDVCLVGMRTGKLNHRGRDGRPVTLLVGDESVPSVVGYTREGKVEGQGDECVWIFKKEHMGLDEVSVILRKINLDKRAADRQAGKRDHDFFLPNGSKVLVASYVHLRREGLDGYVGDFNTMVRLRRLFIHDFLHDNTLFFHNYYIVYNIITRTLLFHWIHLVPNFFFFPLRGN